ncbi:MAG: hypothetical protein KIT62_11215 [Cyclobacteriaceae bacterium]|nr:hypothetical protein [Cyclobacteriaceae bacterium]
MKQSLLVFFSFLILAGCSKPETYSPRQLSAGKQEALKQSMVRYFAKRPETASEETKFEARFDPYYEAKAKETVLLFYHPTDSVYSMLVSQVAPSMVGKRHATGIRFKLNNQGEITEYEEVFRTWKMLLDTLQKRGLFLFDKMVKGESLEPYQTKNSNGTEYIEFPDDLNHYDKEARRWKFTPAQDTLINFN